MDYQRKKKAIIEELEREYDTSQLSNSEMTDYVREKLNMRFAPEQERKQNKVNRFNPAYFTVLDYFDYM